MNNGAKEVWGISEPYERYVGRWSRMVAQEFLSWLELPPGKIWGDVGCGTGALVTSILAAYNPKMVFAIDRSQGFLNQARQAIPDERVRFELADATALPWAAAACDVTVSGLVLNFVPEPAIMVSEMARVTGPGGKVAAYVWDYSGGMEMMRHFWDVALEVNPEDARLDEAERFPLCRPEPLEALFRSAGLSSVVVRAIDVPTVFHNFDDYWTPFLGGQGAAPTYLASLSDETRDRIRERLRARLEPSMGASIAMMARAWAVKSTI